MLKSIIIYIIMLFADDLLANQIVNVYAWGGEIPQQVIQDFERDTHIKVNFSTYDSNETLYTKLLTSKQSVYDVILPSAYFVERMKKQNMLTPLQHNKLTNLKNIDVNFTQNDYDYNNKYSVPLLWGATGIFYNNHWIKKPPTTWNAFWNKKWHAKLMLPDDLREVFAMALMSLGYSPNDENPAHIKAAYKKLLALIPNIKLFGSDGVHAMMIDEDVIAGIAWNGDVVKAHKENHALNFAYPSDGFVIWVDCLAIPINPPHLNAAYKFINYMLKAQIAAKIAQIEGHATANLAGMKLLSPKIQQNITAYPTASILSRGHVQRDVNNATLALYNKYWEMFKLSF